MDKRGVATGTIILVLVAMVVLYFAIPSINTAVNNFFGGLGTPEEPGKCPSSGLTEVTINTQEALASTATNAGTDYYIFDKDGVFITTGASGSDGQSVFDLECAIGKKYDAIVFNDTANDGFYAQKIEIDASGPTDTHNLKMYQYGEVNLVSVASSTDPLGYNQVAAGTGKTCGITITFNENETASAFNKPLIMCMFNTTEVVDIDLNGVNEADSKKPTRITPISGYTYQTFELDKLLKSTDSAQKISGTVEFDGTTTTFGGSINCTIADQATWLKAEYQTLSLNEGFLVGAENSESRANVGGPDTSTASHPGRLHFNGTYC